MKIIQATKAAIAAAQCLGGRETIYSVADNRWLKLRVTDRGSRSWLVVRRVGGMLTTFFLCSYNVTIHDFCLVLSVFKKKKLNMTCITRFM